MKVNNAAFEIVQIIKQEEASEFLFPKSREWNRPLLWWKFSTVDGRTPDYKFPGRILAANTHRLSETGLFLVLLHLCCFGSWGHRPYIPKDLGGGEKKYIIEKSHGLWEWKRQARVKLSDNCKQSQWFSEPGRSNSVSCPGCKKIHTVPVQAL